MKYALVNHREIIRREFGGYILPSRIYLTGIGITRKTFTLVDSSGFIIKTFSKRKYFRSFKHFHENTKMQYLESETNFMGLLLLTIKKQIDFIRMNGVKGLFELFLGQEIDIPLDFNVNLPIKLSLNKKSKYWISRCAINGGLWYDAIGDEIEYNRLKLAKEYDGFVWNFSHQQKSILENHKIGYFPISTKLEIIENLKECVIPPSKELHFRVIENAVINHGETVLKGKEVIRTQSDTGIETKSWPTSFVFQKESKLFSIAPHDNLDITLNKAVFLGSSSNWYHFLVEILPRFLKFIREQDAYNFDLIVRSPLPKSILDIVNLMNFRSVVLMSHGQTLEVKKLFTCSDFRFRNSFDATLRSKDLNSVRNYLLEFSKNKRDIKRVFLIRDEKSFRKIKGIYKLQNRLSKLGFVYINPSSLNFLEQIDIISNVEILISESGAGLTNIMFLPSGSKVIEIHPGIGQRDYWSRFGSNFKIELQTFYANPRHFLFRNLSRYDSVLNVQNAYKFILKTINS